MEENVVHINRRQSGYLAAAFYAFHLFFFIRKKQKISKEFINADCLSKHCADNMKRQLFICLHAPLNERQAAVFDFNTGNAGGVNTASGIAVGRSLCSNHRVVCMTCNKDAMMRFCPAGQPQLGYFFPLIIFGCTGRVRDAELFENTPDVAYEKAGKTPQCTVQQIYLMAVCQINIVPVLFVLPECISCILWMERFSQSSSPSPSSR